MENNEYKSICSRADVFDRVTLEDTRFALKEAHPPSSARVEQILNSRPIEKPTMHSGNEHTDFFRVSVSTSEAEQIVEFLLDLEAKAVDEEGNTTAAASSFGDLVNRWGKYVDLCDERLMS